MAHKINETKVDLRSDTVTQPTPAMRAAMLAAPLGDDVFGDDPSVNALQDKLARMLGFAAALFVPTGTQSNLCAILAHCQRGDEYIVGQYAHCYRWEGGGAAVFGSVQPQPLNHQSDGTLLLADIEAAIKPDDEHFARTRLLALENTLGGKLLPFDYVQRATDLAKARGLSRHLDGARLFNAAVAQAALATGAAPSGGSDPREVGARGERSPAAGPSQGGAAPSGGSDPREVGARGERSPAAGPSQGGAAPSGGSDPHEVGERGGVIHEARRIAQCFDSVSVCLSKGLGAPVGSVLCGSQDFIARARRIRKMAGGGMRQAGLLAAAGTYALDHHIARLADDHALINRLAQGLSGLPDLVVESPQTNILFVDLVGAAKARAPELIPYLAARGILVTGLYRLRFVTHLDVDAAGIERTVAAMRDFLLARP